MFRSMAGLRRRVVTVVAAAALTTSVVAAQPASAETDQQWQRCLTESSASLWFDAPEVTWLESTTIHWSLSAGPDCWSNAFVFFSVVEDTPQDNDHAQGWIVGVGNLSGAMGVTPLRNLPWRVFATSGFGKVPLATASIRVNYPVPPLAGSPGTYRVTDNSVKQRREFVQAVGTPNTAVTVAGNVSLDLSGLDGITVAPGVSISGERNVNPLGPLLFTTTEPGSLFVVPRPENLNPPFTYERISGIRLRGGSSTDPFDNMGDEDSTGITVLKPNVEIDHNEIYLWRGAGVEVMECNVDGACPAPDILRRPPPGDHVSAVWIHDNYIHHDQHPAGDICCGHAAGYGVETAHGAYALIEQNVFDYNRHSIAAGWQPGTGYLLYRNLILPHGGVHSRIAATHAIDVHGSNKNDAFESGDAGEYFDVEYNTVWNDYGTGVKLRGTPADKMEVRHNVFAHCALFADPLNCVTPPALVQNQTGMFVSDNTTTSNGQVRDDARTSCDFDGDGVNDTFHATGITWWFQSSHLAGRYLYLNQSTATGSAVSLADTNNDGLCDVTANGTVYRTDPDQTIGPGLWTAVGLLVGTSDSVARTAITRAGLTIGTVTFRSDSSPRGMVLDQTPHTFHVAALGTPVNLVESTGRATVPDVIGMDAISAQSAIQQAGLTPHQGQDFPVTDPGQDGIVVTQHPAAGTVQDAGSFVGFAIGSIGPPNCAITCPG